MSDRNRLGSEKSPYLLQHKANPVWWYAWGPEAFEAARRENKPIFLSIGYSTCYWCHVMEKDSFERDEVAEVLNKYFVSIKVDREERPDIDQIYMDAVTGLTGHGGWPMSVFLTPDLKPFWGGTFFYRNDFVRILTELHKAWVLRQGEVTQSAQAITDYLKQTIPAEGSTELSAEIFKKAFKYFEDAFDSEEGGFGPAPKFPPAMQLAWLLRWYTRSREPKVLEMTAFTLEKMAHGGIYDHLGGGFHRYSTDERWLVPHFEKMLYDNALLAFTYLEAFQVTRNEMFAEVARETLEYVLRDMTSPEGAFYSAEDAGEVGKEGEFYVWTEEELKQILGSEEFEFAKKGYGISTTGNFEHRTNILNLQKGIPWAAKKDNLARTVHQKLLQARNLKKRPHLDDKILTSWNGLMISAFAKGYQVLRDERYLSAAKRSAAFIKSKLFNGEQLFRRYRDGEARIDAYLEDYAYLIEGLLHLYESDFDLTWVTWAQELQSIQDKRFWDSEQGGFYFSEAKEVIVRKKDYLDNATPAANSVSLLNLLRLYGFFAEREYTLKAERIFKLIAGLLSKVPQGFPKVLQALDYELGDAKQIVIIRGDNLEFFKEATSFFQSAFLPNKVLLAGDESDSLSLFKGKIAQGGKTTIYVCQNNACRLPATTLEQAKRLL